MKRLTILFIPIIFLLIMSSVDAGIWGESVSFIDLHDQRTFSTHHYNPYPLYSQGGLSGYWPFSFTIEWDISQDPNSLLWTYEYTLSAINKEISHFILELTEGTILGDLMGLSVNGRPVSYNEIDGPNYWGIHPSNPGFPATDDIYGIKFDAEGNLVTASFTTKKDPVFGNFYAKSGKHEGKWVHVYNTALGIDDYNSDNPIDFIVRPDGGNNPPIIPEPVSTILFVTGGAVLAVRHHLGKKKKF